MHLPGIFRAWALFASLTLPLSGWAADAEKEPTGEAENEFPSPDGQFAFRAKGDDDSEYKTFELIRVSSGKVLAQVAKSNPEIGPSARFNMAVLWRPDSRAFAVTATFWKRSSTVIVYARDGATFRKIPIPKLLAEISDKAKGGKSFPHIVALNAEEAVRWQKDDSLVVQIQSIQDGEGSTITATRTVTLGFDRPGKAQVQKSSVKYSTEE